MPTDEQKMRQVATEVYNKLGTQWGVAKVPVHTHTGTDTSPIPFQNISSTDNWRKIVRVTLSPSKVKALFSTPITLIPAPKQTMSNLTATNNALIVEGITVFLDYGGTAYAGANALEFRYTDASGIKVTADISSTFLNSTADSWHHAAGIVTAFAPVPCSPIVVRIPTANPTLGTSPLYIVIAYRLVSY